MARGLLRAHRIVALAGRTRRRSRARSTMFLLAAERDGMRRAYVDELN